MNTSSRWHAYNAPIRADADRTSGVATPAWSGVRQCWPRTGQRLRIHTEEVCDVQAIDWCRPAPQPVLGLDGRCGTPVAARIPPAARPGRAGAEGMPRTG